jgi:fucose permease
VAVIQPHRRGQAMNLLHAFYCFGAVAAVMLGALSRQWDMSWLLVCAALALVPATVGIGFTGLILPPLVSESEQRTSARELVMSKTFLAACVVMLLVGGAELAMAQWLPYYAEKSLRYSEWQGGMAFVGFLAAMAAGRVGVGLLGRVDALHLLLWSCVLSAVLYLTASYAPWPGAALGAGIAIGFGVSCLWPSVLGMAADRFPQGGATMFAFLAAFGNLGGIAMPWLVGVCADRWGLNVGLSVATLCPALAVLILGGQILRGRSAARAELSMAPAGQL